MGNRLRVLTYNVHGLADDRAALYRVVRGTAADLVLAQEAPRRLRWRTRCADLARRCGLYFGAGGAPAVGNLIMVGQRVRVLRDRSLRFPLVAGHHMRGVAVADCELPDGTRFTAVGTHLSTTPAIRADQAERLAAVLGAEPAPVVLAADLNERPGGPVWRHLTGVLRDPADGRAAGTYPATNPRTRLDAVLAPAGSTIHEYAALATPDTRRASDHLPVYAELSL